MRTQANRSGRRRDIVSQRNTITIHGPRMGENCSLWLHRLVEERSDIEVDESITAYLKATEHGMAWPGINLFQVYDVLAEVDYDEILQDLPRDERAGFGHALSLIEQQSYGSNGHLLPRDTNVFHLDGSNLLMIEGLPRRKVWYLRVLESTSRCATLHAGTRLFRCVEQRPGA